MTNYEIELRTKELNCRIPILGWLVRWFAAKALAGDGSSKAVEALARAYTNNFDRRVRSIAFRHLDGLESRSGVNAVCSVWAELRDNVLEDLLLRKGWIASTPIELRILTSLLQDNTKPFKSMDAKSVDPLIGLVDDQNLKISARAREIILAQKNPDIRNQVCRSAMDSSNSLVLQLLIDAQYLPADPQQRAAFLFVTEQFDKYESLDFDRRLLRSAYVSASDDLKNLITEKLRRTGRTDFLTVLVGDDYRSQAAAMDDQEAEMMVGMLVSNREWEKLWPLVFELSVSWGMIIVGELVSAKWIPESEQDRRVFDQLAGIVANRGPRSRIDFKTKLPPALKRAVANVSGRINDLAFAPNSPLLAIGTGNRKTVIWNFQNAQREKLINGFEHSISCVTYTSAGHLLCSERTNNHSPCSVYLLEDSQLVKIGAHESSVTALEPVNGTAVISAGRDFCVRVWDIEKKEMVSERVFSQYPRSIGVSPDGKMAAVIASGGSIVSLPDLKNMNLGRWAHYSRSRCATFVPDSNSVVVGHYNGNVVHCNIPKTGTATEETAPGSTSSSLLSDLGGPLVGVRSSYNVQLQTTSLVSHSKPVCGVSALSRYPRIISAGADGVVYFISSETLETVGKIELPEGRLTSLKVSPDGAFMALGDSDSRMSLWDLRVLGLPELLQRPCGKSFHDELSVISEMSEESGLSSDVNESLDFLYIVLRYRYRYDIEIGEAAVIQAGEFDIEIEG